MKQKDNSFGVKHELKWASYELRRKSGSAIGRLFGGGRKQNKVQSSKAGKFRESAFIIIMLIIPIINFLLFWVYVNFGQILLAFRQIDSSGHYYFTLANFKEVFEIFGQENSIFLQSLKNTGIFWLMNNVIMFPLLIFCAYVMKKKLMGTRVFRVVFYLPAIVSGVALSAMFMYVFNGGPASDYFQLLRHQDVESFPNYFGEAPYAMAMLLIYNFLTGLGGNLVLISGAMSRVPDELVESAAIDGATMSTEFFKIYLPLCWPTFSTLLIMAAAGFFNSSGEVLLLTRGAGETFTFSFYIFDQVEQYQSYILPSTIGLVLTVIALPVVLIVRHFINKVYADVEF